MHKAIANFLRCTSGNVAVEGALLLPVAVGIMVGAIEFGRAFQNYAAIEKAVRGATRYLARVPPEAVDDWGLERARNLVLTGTVDGSGAYVLGHWRDEDTIALSHAPTADAPKVGLTATVPLRFELLGLVGLSPAITIVVSHEERHVGH